MRYWRIWAFSNLFLIHHHQLLLSSSVSVDVTCLWFSELRPHSSSRSHHRLSVCVSSAGLPLVFPPRVRGGGGRLVRGDHRGRWLGLVTHRNTIKHIKYVCRVKKDIQKHVNNCRFNENKHLQTCNLLKY